MSAFELRIHTNRAVHRNGVLAFLTDVTKIKDDLIIFRRTDVQHSKWYCRMKLPGVDRYNIALKIESLRDAQEKALEHYADFRFRLKHNVPIVSPLATQLSWSHVIEVLGLKTREARLFYLSEAATHQFGKRELRRMIDRKAFERKEIANAQLTEKSAIPLDTFKDPYLMDVLGLHDGFLEADLEAAVLRELESFILELGGGFTFVARQKRMIIGGEDFHLDLLFFHRRLKRLLAVELKIGKFEAAHKGQMELYLGWLNRYERQDGENAPIGLILCAEKSREQIELLQLDQDNIMVAEYWTVFPERPVFERKIHTLLENAREQLARRKALLLVNNKVGEAREPSRKKRGHDAAGNTTSYSGVAATFNNAQVSIGPSDSTRRRDGQMARPERFELRAPMN